MREIAYLVKESGMTPNEILDTPYVIYISLFKQFAIFQLEQTEEGRKLLSLSKTNKMKEPQWNRLRDLDIYKGKVVD